MEKILKGFLSFCLIGMCAFPGAVFAESAGTLAPAVQTTEIPPVPAVPDKGLLMNALDWAGVGPILNKAGIPLPTPW